MALRVLIVEDQLMLQQLLVGMLERHPALEVVGSVGSAAEGITACATLLPDLVILDMALPDGDGLQVAQALHVLRPSARVIVLSSFASTVERPPELSTAIVAILDKNRAFQDLLHEIEPLLPIGLDPLPEPSFNTEQLTQRELEVLQEIGAGHSSKTIAEKLCVSVRTVETHRRSICQKFGLSGAALVHKATLLSRKLA
ncbi:response regulator transcription factor [Cyanobium sp. FACHB-13342]|uniref:response regulator transcription factor n=1 Tax=Cyanobium sp. FACHB-13342 TaxID=2692793 RepID=UPI0016808B78|nr:response regulator transcription factor [Cyanobium sp. FACHB-13342]MBD2423083.1 response regulator transcription factor [Cyanobium sp. FACHB-13342]